MEASTSPPTFHFPAAVLRSARHLCQASWDVWHVVSVWHTNTSPKKVMPEPLCIERPAPDFRLRFGHSIRRYWLRRGKLQVRYGIVTCPTAFSSKTSLLPGGFCIQKVPLLKKETINHVKLQTIPKRLECTPNWQNDVDCEARPNSVSESQP